MLSELNICNIGTVKEARLQLSSGLTVITGETGAGKSTLLNGLRLLMGGRADSKIVRVDSKRADVSGVWSISSEKLKAALSEGPGELEGDELFISRFVQADGKSRLVFGGVPVPASTVAPYADSLVEIHGQADQLRLKDTSVQRSIIDRRGGNFTDSALSSYQESFKTLRKLRAHLKDLQENSSHREIEHRYNQDLAARFDELDPQENELEQLEAEIEKLSHLEEIGDGLRDAMSVALPESGEGPLAALQEVASTLSKLGRYDSKLDDLAAQFDEAISGLEPATMELESYVEDMDLDSIQKLHEHEDRLSELQIFAKPFGGDLNRAIETSLKAQEAIARFENELPLDELQEELRAQEETTIALAAKLTQARSKAANGLAKAVNVELEGLAMRGTTFVAEINPKALASDGGDEVSFMIETQGKNRRPITKAASGGELSRIMLALEVVTAGASSGGTLVFDEVDSGVGGATAIEIGRRLARLAVRHQVIVVSHLPQVAAFGDSHFVVAKNMSETEVTTTIEEVSEGARVREISRMLSGLDSDSGLIHAEELLAVAAGDKDSWR